MAAIENFQVANVLQVSSMMESTKTVRNVLTIVEIAHMLLQTVVNVLVRGEINLQCQNVIARLGILIMDLRIVLSVIRNAKRAILVVVIV